MGAGVSGAIGAVFAGVALAARSDADELCSSVDGSGAICPNEASDAIDRDIALSAVADVAFGVGIVAAGVGLYFIITGEPKPSDTTVAVMMDGRSMALEASRLPERAVFTLVRRLMPRMNRSAAAM